jgi:hypothetical protein
MGGETLAAAGLAAAVTAGLSLAARRERQAAANLTRELDASARRAATVFAANRSLNSLPAPVQRYLRLAMPEAPAHLSRVWLRQRGALRTGTRAASWLRFTAEHQVAPRAVGFVWNARVALFPGAHLRVLDSLIDGRGAGRVSLMSVLRLSAAAGDLQMNSGSVHRFLAEAVWYPSALLPSARLCWSPIDDHRALATLTTGDVGVSLEFRFNAAGEAILVCTPGRWGRFADGYRQVAWEGRFGDYTVIDGMRVPRHGEVGWYDDRLWRKVWEGSIEEFRYERWGGVEAG